MDPDVAAGPIPVRRWSVKTLERLYQASRLCERCLSMHDESRPRTLIKKESIRLVCEHHTSYEALRRSAQAGCVICFGLQDRWDRYLVMRSGTHRSLYGDQDTVAFWFATAISGPTFIDLGALPKEPGAPLLELLPYVVKKGMTSLPSSYALSEYEQDR